MKRQRGRGRNNKPGMQNPNRAYESAGPDIKVRGSAQTIFEKYQQLGRDAMGSGDRIIAENYLQHAEHYLRLIRAIQPNFVPRSEFAIAGLPSDSEDDVDENDANENDSDGENDGDESSGDEQAREPREPREPRDNNGRYDRFNKNRRGRDRYRNENRQSQETADGDVAAVVAADVSENAPNVAAEGSDEVRAPRQRTPRTRSMRLPRKPRENDDAAPKEGFGDEMPAFLATPVASAEVE